MAIINFTVALSLAILFVIAPVATGQQTIDTDANGYDVPYNLVKNPVVSGSLPDTGSWAPVSPDPGYTGNVEPVISDNQSPADRTHGLGYTPAPVRVSVENTLKTSRAMLKTLVSYPSTYDLRTLGKVTPVKDQGSIGTCWAFAAYGSLESCLLPAESRDFSESNMKNLAGFDNDPNTGGGDMWMAMAYLTRWAGPVNETDDPYRYPYSKTSPSGLKVQEHVQDVIALPVRTGPLDNGAIKSALINYGGVWASMCWKDTSYDATYSSYYYDYGMGDYDGGHAVTIVGWDDNYDRNRFSSPPPGNGAFIAKNSWGPGWGDVGYFYVSYYDSAFADNAAVFLSEPVSNYDYIYQYDPLGWTYNLRFYDSDVAWFANVFTAKSNEMLEAVGFYVPAQGESFDIYVFDEDGLIATRTGITNPPMGYHTFELDAPALLSAGESFSIEVRISRPGATYTDVCTETPLSGYSSRAIANASESYISPDGTDWYDVTTLFPAVSETNVCLKAYTSDPQVLQFRTTGYDVNRNAGTVTLTIARSSLTGQTAYVDYSTVDDTAVAGMDYVAKSGRITFLPSETEKTITIDILDTQSFVDRQFFVNLSSPANAVLGTGRNATVTIHSSHRPIQTVKAPPMQGTGQITGGVSGRVALNTSAGVGLANTYVAIVNARNTSQAYSIGLTDPNGVFQFTDINHTWDVSANGYMPIYRLYVNQTIFGESFSSNFSVFPGATAIANAVITAMPAHMALTAANNTMVANASDNVTVSAYVTDAFNYPVVDGTTVVFTKADPTAGNGQFGPYSGTAPTGNSITATTVNGYARARFGWATNTGTITIKAAWAEDGRIYASSAETLLQSPPPTIRFTTASVTVDENEGHAVLTLEKVGYAASTASISFSASGGNATADKNFRVIVGTIEFAPSETVKTAWIPILDDGVYGSQKMFYVNIHSPVNAALDPGDTTIPVYINNVDSPPTIYLDSTSVAVYDNSGIVTVNVLKEGDTEFDSRVDYLTLNGTAKAGLDFTNASGTLTFAPGERKKTISMAILPDAAYEDDETFSLHLLNPDKAVLNASKTATVSVSTSIPHQHVDLAKGWNLVSIPLVLEDKNVSHLFPANVLSNVIVVWAWNSTQQAYKFYTPITGYNSTLSEIDEGMGFWVYSTVDQSFTVSGQLPADSSITLNRGWNLIGNPVMTDRTPASVYSDYLVVWSWDRTKQAYRLYTPVSGYTSTLTALSPGYGYWVYKQ